MLTKLILNQIKGDILTAIKDVEKKHNIKIKFNGGRFDDTTANMKLQINAIVNGKTVNPFAKELEHIIDTFNLDNNKIKESFVFQGQTFTVTGFKRRNRKFPVIASSNSKSYKLPIEVLKPFITNDEDFQTMKLIY